MSQVAKELAELERDVEGLAVDRLPLDAGIAVRRRNDRRHGRSNPDRCLDRGRICAGERPIPAPGPEFGLRGGDTLVVVGTPRGIEELAVLLRSG